MYTSHSDTLDITPRHPGHNQPEAKQPEAAEAARARIADLPDPHEAPTQPQPGNPVQEAATEVPAVATPAQPAAKKRRGGRLRPILSAVAAFVFLLAIFKSPVILSQLNYLRSKPDANHLAVAPPPGVGSEPVISIPKINVSAPVIYEPSIQEAKVQKGLESGVVHYGNTPVPGQAGNSVIVGHSSNDWWEPGNYKFVFVLLDKLVPGDRISQNYQSKKYIYEVTKVYVVEPTDLTVLTSTNEPTLTLITCTPPGTSWKRLIVKAKQVSPDPSTTTAVAKANIDQNITLPGSAPSFSGQAGKAWDGLKSAISRLFGSG